VFETVETNENIHSKHKHVARAIVFTLLLLFSLTLTLSSFCTFGKKPVIAPIFEYVASKAFATATAA